jgi:hypothetical protein
VGTRLSNAARSSNAEFGAQYATLFDRPPAYHMSHRSSPGDPSETERGLALDLRPAGRLSADDSLAMTGRGDEWRWSDQTLDCLRWDTVDPVAD